MKKILSLTGLCALIIVSNGCVATTLSHSITVERDADGKIIKTLETEGIVQPNAENMSKIKFKTLDLPK